MKKYMIYAALASTNVCKMTAGCLVAPKEKIPLRPDPPAHARILFL